MTEDDFLKKYEPHKNHFDLNAAHDGCMFETYGPELEYVREIVKQNPKTVWTIIDDNSGWYGIIAGMHWINRMGYLITKQEWQDKNEEYTIYDTTGIQEEWDKLPVEALEEVIGEPLKHRTEMELCEIRDENFYKWEELDEDQRENIVKKYKNK